MSLMCDEESSGLWVYADDGITIHLSRATGVRAGVATTVTQDFPKEGACAI